MDFMNYLRSSVFLPLLNLACLYNASCLDDIFLSELLAILCPPAFNRSYHYLFSCIQFGDFQNMRKL